MDEMVILQMVGFQLPTILVASVGAILGLANLRRMPSSALMALLGCGFIALVSLCTLALRIVFWQQFRAGEIPPARYSQMLSLVSIVSSIGHAGGLTLVVIAVFVGRAAKPAPITDPDEPV